MEDHCRFFLLTTNSSFLLIIFGEILIKDKMKKALTLLVTLALSCNSSQKTLKEATSEAVSEEASEITFC